MTQKRVTLNFKESGAATLTYQEEQLSDLRCARQVLIRNRWFQALPGNGWSSPNELENSSFLNSILLRHTEFWYENYPFLCDGEVYSGSSDAIEEECKFRS